MKQPIFAVAILFVAAAAAAQHEDLTAIQDNSFLIEEAYNQEAGVVQHIGVFERDVEGDGWALGLTQEWPWRSQKHQLSYTIPFADGDLGDVMLNYRYQLRGTGDSTLAIAPRLSLILPTGDDGQTGLQFNLPISRVYGSRLIGHTNVGGTIGDEWDLFAGQSFIYALSSRVHLMAEAVWKGSDAETEVFVSPGVRWAHNVPGGLQIVPGVAFPIGVGASSGDRSVLFYISFEHPFTK